ncbi:MAG: circadian clock protein KaiC [Candidatus Competibacteraceae bacterium]
MTETQSEFTSRQLPKAPTGIRGLDDITGGGLPVGRPTLICGGAGCGKTLLAMEFLIHGAMQYGEPGAFVAFEETAEDLTKNMASLGVDLDGLAAARKLVVDSINLERIQFEETGEYNLEGLFIRLGHIIHSIGARRVVLDTVETLFATLPNEAVVRAELRRLFGWLKTRGVTAVITGESGDKTMTRYGIEEYVSDCVIVLDHRVTEQISTRRLRVMKYRGSAHGVNEYPYLIDQTGISVLPITSLGLEHVASQERISSGIAPLDAMLGGQGYYRGSSILVSGTAGSGKTSMTAHFTDAACRRGERCLMFLFEESPSQLMRNMSSIGIDLEPWTQQDLLRFHAARPSLYGLEMHLAFTLKLIDEWEPRIVVVDPISSFDALGDPFQIKAMLVRLVDSLKVRGVTTLLTSLTPAGTAQEHTEQEISSLIDTWLLLRDMESNGERNRGLYVLKSRGMAHSHQIREFVLTGHGVELLDVYLGPGGVLTGSARLAQEARERAEQLTARQEVERQQLALERKRQAMESRIAALRAEYAAEEVEALRLIDQEQQREQRLALDRVEMERQRGGDANSPAARED